MNNLGPWRVSTKKGLDSGAGRDLGIRRRSRPQQTHESKESQVQNITAGHTAPHRTHFHDPNFKQ